LIPELLPFICQTDAFFNHALGTSAGSLSPRTSWSALQNFEFPLAPLEEQKRIAEILLAADETLERYNDVNNSLRRQEQSLIAQHMPLDVPFSLLRRGQIPGIESARLKEVCDKITDGTHLPPTFTKSG